MVVLKYSLYFLPTFLLLLPSTWRYGFPSQLLVGVGNIIIISYYNTERVCVKNFWVQ
jgi:hypothetical protein